MRRPLCSALLALTATALVVTTTGPAGAMRAEPDRAPYHRAGLRCDAGVVAVDDQRRVSNYDVRNDRVTRITVAAKPLDFDATAWGYFDSATRGKKRTLELDAVGTDGIPRRVTLKQTKTSIQRGRIHRYDQRSFRPRLFADGYTYYAYTISGGTLKRWSLTRFRGNKVSWAQPVKIGKGYGDWTSLQTTTFGKVHGVPSEILYGTTSAGQLRQVVVPAKHPSNAREHGLATGLTGVTELVFSICNRDENHHALYAIDPTANRATWVTVKNASSKPKATVHGLVTGATNWHFTAAF